MLLTPLTALRATVILCCAALVVLSAVHIQGVPPERSWGLGIALGEVLSLHNSWLPLGIRDTLPPSINELIQGARGPFSQDVYALSDSGVWVVKQSPFLAYLYLPFTVLGSAPVLFGHLFWSLSAVATLVLLVPSLLVSTVGIGLLLVFSVAGVQVIGLLWSPSVEAPAITMVATALLLRRRAPVFAGLMIGLTPLLRPNNVILVCSLAAILAIGRTRAQHSRLLYGTASGVALSGAFCWALFGAPWICSYHRIPTFSPHGLGGFEAHSFGFDSKVLLNNLGAFFDSPQFGLLYWNPLLPVLLLATAITPSLRSDRMITALWFGLLVTAVHILSYPYLESSVIGNRYLATILLPLQFAVLEQLVQCLRTRLGKYLCWPAKRSNEPT